MGVIDRNRILNNFEFNPTTKFNFANNNTVEINQPLQATTDPEEPVLEMSSREPVAEKAINNEETEIIFPDKYSGLAEFYKSIGNTVGTKEAKYALLAQMGLESGWGKLSAGSKHYNYGNITTGSSWTGDYFKGKDKNAAGDTITQKFRRYGSADEFYKDYINLISTKYPEAYEQLKSNNFDIDKFSYGLRHGRVGMYAESPEYEKSLRTVYQSVLQTMSPKKTTEIRRSGGILYKFN